MTRLVPIHRLDPEKLLAWRNDPAVTEHLARRRWSREDVDRWFDTPGRAERAYGVEVDGRVVGYANLSNIDSANRKCQVGVVLGDTSCWGRGIGTTAAELVTAVAFEQLGMHRVLAVVSEQNTGSLRCFRKAGFREEGRLRHASRRDDVYVDLVLLSVIEPEWTSRGVAPTES